MKSIVSGFFWMGVGMIVRGLWDHNAFSIVVGSLTCVFLLWGEWMRARKGYSDALWFKPTPYDKEPEPR
jgi:hypothetical protein